MKNLIAITGCDSGIGRSLASVCLERGFSVALSYLDENPFEGVPDAFAERMDLRREGDVESFAEFVKGRCASGYPLCCLVNNAGVALGGPFENLPMKLFRETFEINYFGLVRLSQLLLPELIESRGKLVVVGSLAGRIALPFLSPYTSTKFALEGFCDSVRRELLPFGIKTILLEVAGVATPIWNKALRQDTSFVGEKYSLSMRELREKFILPGNDSLETSRAAEVIARIIESRSPRARYIVSKSPLLDRFKTLIPSSLLDRIVLKAFSMRYGGS